MSVVRGGNANSELHVRAVQYWHFVTDRGTNNLRRTHAYIVEALRLVPPIRVAGSDTHTQMASHNDCATCNWSMVR